MPGPVGRKRKATRGRSVPEPVRLTFLGGIGEIGRNCAVLEIDEKLLVIDCGLLFPDPDMPGVDLVLPDFQFLAERAPQVVGCVVTHGHEDHTGALAYLIEAMDRPEPLTIWGSALALGIARSRLDETNTAARALLVPVGDGERWQAGPFDIEAIPVTHSVPEGHALVFRTPQGVILHTGDFKLDPTPVDGRATDLARIGAVADDEGIRLLLSDSTNADEPGFTESERVVGATLRRLLAAATGERVIVTCFASHLHRIQQVADAAIGAGRVVATLGRSMGRNVALARAQGVLHIPDDRIVAIEEVDDLDPGKVCVLSTGSQGEPMSALVMMASGQSKWLKIRDGDVVVMSSHAIPGNEWAVSKLIDDLYRRGADVVYAERDAVHVSGHARQGELRMMLTLTRPEWFVPVHGEHRHLVSHARLAKEAGVEQDHVLVCEDGNVLTLGDEGVAHTGDVAAGHVYVDGIAGDVGLGVLRDRRMLAEDGVIVVIVGVDDLAGEVVIGPEIVTRGWVYVDDAGELIDAARDAVRDALEAALAGGTRDHDGLRLAVRRSTGKLVKERTRRRPMIVPVILPV